MTTVSGISGHGSTQMTFDDYGLFYEEDAMTCMDRLGKTLFSGTVKERSNLVSVTRKVDG